MHGNGNGNRQSDPLSLWEAEWEYAACAGGQARYSGGDDAGQAAWFKDNAKDQTHPVKTRAANDWGLFDMSGNVWE
jgi:formylglycine-generating enzyme required for sulfatase activity